MVVNFLTLLWYNPNLDQDCPPWVYASWAAGLFLYQTFDAVDGTQAYVFPFGWMEFWGNMLIDVGVGGGLDKVARWESCLTMVCMG